MRLLLLFVLAGWQVPGLGLSLQATPAASLRHENSAANAGRAPTRAALRNQQNGQTAYLFGTIHVGQANFFPLELVVTQAMVQSSELVVELDASQATRCRPAILRHAIAAATPSLDGLLLPPCSSSLHTQLDALGIPREAVQP